MDKGVENSLADSFERVFAFICAFTVFIYDRFLMDCFGTLKGRVANYNPGFSFGGSFDKPKLEAKVNELVEEMHNNEASVDRNKISDMLKLTNTQCKYVVDTKGNVYCKTIA